MPTVTHSVALPVHGSPDLWRLLGDCWEQSTALANWGAQRCARHDVTRTPGMERLPPFPPWPESGPSDYSPRRNKGLYGLAVHELGMATKGDFWSGAAISASTLLRDVEAHWRRHRYAVLWMRNEAPVLWHYPRPWPVHPQAWSARMESGKPVIHARLPGGAVDLSLRGGPEFGRQLASFRQVAEGKLKRATLYLTRQRASEGCHRPTMQEPRTAGEQRTHWRVMARFAVTREVQARESERVLNVNTDPEALLVAEIDGRRAWVLNADHVRRAVEWQQVHEVRRQRWAQDVKAERRASQKILRQFEASRERCCDRHARRMNSWCQETASHLARFAARQRVGLVAYDDTAKSYLPLFPWYKLRLCVAHAMAGLGIEIVAPPDHASGGVVNESPDAARVAEVS